MHKKEIKVSKTARYFMLNTPNEDIKDVWIVCHGYAQLAQYFLRKFECVEDKSRLIVAPEGLHRFYWNGFSGRVVASWMTKEDRVEDIKDYVNMLDNVVLELKKELNNTVNIHVLGFSQGAATVCRWLTMGNTKFDSLTIWGGAFPDDINYFEKKNKFNEIPLNVVLGDSDEYYSDDKISSEIRGLKEKEIVFNLHRYEGKHDLYESPLKKVFSQKK